MAAIKPEDISHSPMDQLQGLEYCIDSNPSWGMFACIYSFNLYCEWFCYVNDMFVFWIVNSGDNTTWFSTLYFGIRNCSYDSFISCSFNGWKWCKPFPNFNSFNYYNWLIDENEIIWCTLCKSLLRKFFLFPFYCVWINIFTIGPNESN